MTKDRYHVSVIALHWLMALGFLIMLGTGYVMVNVELSKVTQFQLYQFHKSVGVILLLLVTIRIINRVIFKPPALPSILSKLDVALAKLGHLGLYLLMVTVPLSGWLIVSASIFAIPTFVFGLFEWPHIPFITINPTLESIAKTIHFYLAITFACLIVIHILAVVKHLAVDKINLIKRMWVKEF